MECQPVEHSRNRAHRVGARFGSRRGLLVAPDWVPWADRLEEYLLHEQELKALEAEDEDDGEDALEIDDDVDGVDIDQLDVELDPTPLEVPDEPDDLFDHVELDEPDPLDP